MIDNKVIVKACKKAGGVILTYHIEQDIYLIATRYFIVKVDKYQVDPLRKALGILSVDEYTVLKAHESSVSSENVLKLWERNSQCLPERQISHTELTYKGCAIYLDGNNVATGLQVEYAELTKGTPDIRQKNPSDVIIAEGLFIISPYRLNIKEIHIKAE